MVYCMIKMWSFNHFILVSQQTSEINFSDIYECISYPCDTNAECIEGINSYTCECNEGFIGDGITCIGNLIIIFNKENLDCPSGFPGRQYEIDNSVLIL